MDKTQFMNNLNSIDELSKLLESVLVNMKLHDVKRIAGDILEAKEQTSLRIRKIYFVLTLSELNSKIDTIKDKITELNNSYDTVYIVTSQRQLSDYFKNWIKDFFPKLDLQFWSCKELIKNVDDYYPEYWEHYDSFIKSYEKYYNESIEKDADLRRVLKLDPKYDKLLNIFIEPNIYSRLKDAETGRLTRIKTTEHNLIQNGCFVISGDAGTGKTTLMKELGKLFIKKNMYSHEKNIPLLIKANDIIENSHNVAKIIEAILLRTYETFDLDVIYRQYNLILLFDSLDEFDKDIQVNIIKEVEELHNKKNIRYFIGTRNYEYLLTDCELCDHERVELHNFDLRQVKIFLDSFFRFDLGKSDKLWISLRENNILDKIPITPLTLSLISILFEEKQYEIPATITDIYDNFNLFLLGRTSVKSNLEFLDINIKERILSLYAFEIIMDKERRKKNKEEFISFIESFFNKRNITIDKSAIPELINSLTQGTGVLFLDDAGKINFKHDYFMEYYASLEIFKHKRESEKELIDRFTEYNWQNATIFYTGRTKDMPEFLIELIERVKKYTELKDCLIAVSGMGYILQSLWLTDSVIRKDGVIEALNLLIKADGKIKEFASAGFPFFSNIKDIDIALMNFSWFLYHYNSITLKDTLCLAFDDLHIQLNDMQKTVFQRDRITLFYKLFCIGAALSADRLNQEDRILKLIEDDQMLTIPLFVVLFDIGLDFVETNHSLELKESFDIKRRKKKYFEAIKFYLDNSAEKLRLTSYECIKQPKNVEIFTEGKTDAEIISHAFKVLTKDEEPYWNIQACNNTSGSTGGASELAKFLSSLAPKLEIDSDKSKIVVGIFDNDAKGNQEFNGLKQGLFIELSKRIKKHIEQNIYAIKLAIPPYKEYEAYHQEKQEFKFFSIEHYFPMEILENHKIVKETRIPGVFEIKGDKARFSTEIQKDYNYDTFKYFIYLFEEIDEIGKEKPNYRKI